MSAFHPGNGGRREGANQRLRTQPHQQNRCMTIQGPSQHHSPLMEFAPEALSNTLLGPMEMCIVNTAQRAPPPPVLRVSPEA